MLTGIWQMSLQMTWQLSNAMLLCYAMYTDCMPERYSSASLLQMLLPHCSSVPLLCCCSAAQVQLVVLCNHWVRLHYCTLLGCSSSCSSSWTRLGLGWRVQTFFVSLFELASLGYLGLGSLGTLNKCLHEKLSKLSKFTASSCSSPFDEEKLEKRSSFWRRTWNWRK